MADELFDSQQNAFRPTVVERSAATTISAIGVRVLKGRTVEQLEEGYFTKFNSSSSVHGFWRSVVAERTSRTVESSTGGPSFPQARRM